MRCSPRQQHAWSVLPPRCEHVSGLAPSQSALALMWSPLTAVVRNHSLVAPISIPVPRSGWRIIRLDRATGHRQIVGKFSSRSRCSLLKEHRRHCLGCASPSSLARARAKGTKSGKPIGRPALTPTICNAIRQAYTDRGVSMRVVAKQFNVSAETVRRCLQAA